MSIRRAVAWLFDVGDGAEAEALEAARAMDRQRQDAGSSEGADIPLYGEAEAIRVLYQMTVVARGPSKPPRPRGRRGRWAARLLDSFTPSLRHPAAAKA
jgi:hypothetical protein